MLPAPVQSKVVWCRWGPNSRNVCQVNQLADDCGFGQRLLHCPSRIPEGNRQLDRGSLTSVARRFWPDADGEAAAGV
jgi:hypothetical protein